MEGGRDVLRALLEAEKTQAPTFWKLSRKQELIADVILAAVIQDPLRGCPLVHRTYAGSGPDL